MTNENRMSLTRYLLDFDAEVKNRLGKDFLGAEMDIIESNETPATSTITNRGLRMAIAEFLLCSGVPVDEVRDFLPACGEALSPSVLVSLILNAGTWLAARDGDQGPLTHPTEQEWRESPDLQHRAVAGCMALAFRIACVSAQETISDWVDGRAYKSHIMTGFGLARYEHSIDGNELIIARVRTVSIALLLEQQLAMLRGFRDVPDERLGDAVVAMERLFLYVTPKTTEECRQLASIVAETYGT